jgi:hypothetical protein
MNSSKPDLKELRDYWAWRELSHELTLVDYAGYKLTSDLAVACVSLFYPTFIEIEDCILLEWVYSPDNYRRWKNVFAGDRRQVETMLNHQHISDLLNYASVNMSYTNIAYFGETLKATWLCALNNRFPDRMFSIIGEKDGEFDDYVITFCQI